VLCGVYARGGSAWPLGFVMLVPWLLALRHAASSATRLLLTLGMTWVFVLAVFGWFVPAIVAYTGWTTLSATALLLACGPLLQPQFLAYAIARDLAGRRFPPAMCAIVAIAAWLATEWAVPRLFGDTLGHGLHPSRWLRQGADVAGAAGLTLALLVANEGVAHAIARRRDGPRAWTPPLGIALAVPVLLAGYGLARLSVLERTATTPAVPLRIGLVQAGITGYDRLRRERGAHAVVRHVLDTHFALSLRARGAQGVDALVWSETVYPTTFQAPRSEAGAAFDREIVGFVRQTGMPLVFGTYARDPAGEYNAAAVVDPLDGPIGLYRKTRLFPLSEYVPSRIDTPVLRRAFPWLGTWRPGDGARVFPLRTLDGREIPVVPLICRDDVDPQLAIDGARLGAQVIVGLSNDAWFAQAAQGARLHLAVATFRSIETRLPQVRATTDGPSAVIDATGDVVARTAMGTSTVLAGDVQARVPPPTPVVRFGLWLGPAAAILLALVAVSAAAARLRLRSAGTANAGAVDADDDAAVHGLLLAPWQRALLSLLRSAARLAVLVLGLAALAGDGGGGMLMQLRRFALLVLAPEALAWAIAWSAAARARIVDGHLAIDSRWRRIEIPLPSIASARAWRMPLPGSGLDLRLASGARWPQGLALRDPDAFAAWLARAGARIDPSPQATRRAWRDRALAIRPHRFDHPLAKFVLFPLVPALPAFRLHQHIAYGGTFGEWQTFGAGAWFGALGLWWASWAVALVLLAGGLRAVVETASAAVLAWRPERAVRTRATLLATARLLYYLGVPLWLGLRLLDG
jgi:apolipoprotein N-acyltransferase